MADTLTPAKRSERMSRIKGKDTAPEMILRRLVHGMGYRYRLHIKELPGTPDLVFPRHHAVIFMHGCFWHRHDQCKLARLPKSRLEFWQDKLEANKQRDLINQQKLMLLGWRVLVIWECELKDIMYVATVVRKFLNESTDEEQ